MDSWYLITFTIPSDLSDIVSGHLFELGSCGLQVEDGPTPWSVTVRAYFASSQDRAHVTACLRHLLDPLLASSGVSHKTPPLVSSMRAEDVPNEDWASAWRRFFQPLYPTPRIVVCPPWDVRPAPESGICVIVEPARAFGTGRHESTRLALRALADAVSPGDSVLDVGTGSGILAAAALKLGASRLTAVDVDPDVVDSALETLERNGFVADGEPTGISVAAGTAGGTTGQFDVVVANITADVLGPMIGDLRARTRPSGRMILSGILSTEMEDLQAWMVGAGTQVVRVYEEAEWVSVMAVPVQRGTER